MARIIKSFSELFLLKQDLFCKKESSTGLLPKVFKQKSPVANAFPSTISGLETSAQKEHVVTPNNDAANHLHANGIHHLWHLTDRRNLEHIQQEKGLLSYSKLTTTNHSGIQFLSNEISRNCDAYWDRSRFVHLSFVPNSWFFHRVYKNYSTPLVWLCFSTHVLDLPEVKYTCGNAASGSVRPNSNLARTGIEWALIKTFMGAYSDNKGPINYFALYKYEIERSEVFKQLRKNTNIQLGHLSDQAFFSMLSHNWNSEILVKDFLPLELCSTIYDCRTGKIIPF